MTLPLAVLLGFCAGLRSLVAPAACAWGAYLGLLKLEYPLALIGALPAVVVLTLLAAAELVADKMPQTPNRTASPGLIARIVTGGLSGACIAAAGAQRVLFGAALGVTGAVAGCFLGYHTRKRLVRISAIRDAQIALVEDLVAIGLAVCVVALV